MSEHLDDALLRRYLAGDCTDEECGRVEAQLFADDETFERICALDDDLVARYARGEANETERAHVDRRLRQHGARERILLDLALRRYAGEAASRGPAEPLVLRSPVPHDAVAAGATPPWTATAWRLGLAAAGLLLAVALVTSRRQAAEMEEALDAARRQAQDLSGQLESAREEARAQGQRAGELAAQLAREQAARDAAARPAAPVFATFLLSPGLTRGTQPPVRVAVPGTVDGLRLRLERDTNLSASRYRAELRTADGAVVWSDEVPPAAGSAPLVVSLPAALLSNGEYELVLFGMLTGRFEDLASYHFVVTRR
ncbi:MAG: hypothetical protein AB7P99_16065 [Vicinamibacterales bacterium]